MPFRIGNFLYNEQYPELIFRARRRRKREKNEGSKESSFPFQRLRGIRLRHLRCSPPWFSLLSSPSVSSHLSLSLSLKSSLLFGINVCTERRLWSYHWKAMELRIRKLLQRSFTMLILRAIIRYFFYSIHNCTLLSCSKLYS